MNKKFGIGLFVVAACVLALLGIGFVQYTISGTPQKTERVWHHEIAAEADVTLGTDSVPDDFMVDGSFTSHLPLVIIDTFGQEIADYKYYDPETFSFILPEGVDPYAQMQISVIDNPDFVNTLSDTPSYVSEGKIKVRGNSSSKYAKKQYLLKLQDEDGDKSPISMLGMDQSDTWILNGTMIDRSYLRNYVSLNIAGELNSFTPDIRMCEVVFKNGDQYEYMGLYGMYEKVEQGEGSIDIPPVSNPISVSDRSYVLLRDRMDPTTKSMEVWSTNHLTEADTGHSVGENWINLEYPSASKITEEYWAYIESDIDHIEEALYSDETDTFLQYRNLLDVDSFIDYAIINEFFLNYDAGWNSTFLYKNEEGTVSIGPVWDFDTAIDNYEASAADLNEFPFFISPWYERLVRDKDFVTRLMQRYTELRKTVLSDENIMEKISQAEIFLEKPASRDNSRWADLNTKVLAPDEDKDTGLTIDRQSDTYEEEIQRFQDILLIHAEKMDENLYNYLSGYFVPLELHVSIAGWLLIILFFVSVVLVERVRKGQ